MSEVNLWLDDMRPAPDGYVHVKTVAEARAVLEKFAVTNASLDHDLGACEACMGGRTAEQWLAETNYQAMPHCDHFGTGYDLVCWMEREGIWPQNKPTVHSANPVGRARMRAAIDKSFKSSVSPMERLVIELRDEQRYQTERLGEEDSAKLASLAKRAADEIERLQKLLTGDGVGSLQTDIL